MSRRPVPRRHRRRRLLGRPPAEAQWPPQAGFAMLSALLIAALALLFAGVAVAAVLGVARVTAADAAGARARAVAAAGVELGLHRLCWVLVPSDVEMSCAVPGPGGADHATDVRIESLEPSDIGWAASARLVRVSAHAATGRAAADAVALAILRPSAIPTGVSVVEDADVQAPLDVTGCGMSVGGSTRGRENVTFTAAEGDGVAVDLVHSGRWPIAGVHAGAGIWTAGVEIHELDTVPVAYAYDTDEHVSAPPAPPEGAPASPVGDGAYPGGLLDLVELPGAGWLASARLHALDPAGALTDGVLHLDRLPPFLPTGEPGAADAAGIAEPGAGYLVYVSSRALDGGLAVTGRRDPAWAPVTLVVEGDAALRDAGAGDAAADAPASSSADSTAAAVSFTGALIVTGYLEIAASSAVRGHVACRRLVVAAPLSVAIADDWRARPPLGSLEPLLVARE